MGLVGDVQDLDLEGFPLVSTSRAWLRGVQARPSPAAAEIRRLLARTLLTATRGIDHVLHWSLFRRLHQTRALISHYRHRGDPYQRNCECSTRYAA